MAERKQDIPYMPLWVYDLEADEDCALMSLSEYGAYMKLLQRQWIEGSVPACPARLARLLRLTADQFDEIWSALKPKFVQDGRGRLINRRCSEERQKALAKVEALRANGRKGGRPPKQKDKQIETKEKPSGFNAIGLGCIESSPSDGFEEFWALWPSGGRKSGKKKCREKWKSRKLAERRADVLGGLRQWIASAEWAKDDGAYIPMPETWLNGERWEADPPPAGKPARTTARSLWDGCHNTLSLNGHTWPKADVGPSPDGMRLVHRGTGEVVVEANQLAEVRVDA